MTLLKYENVTLGYGRHTILRDINLELSREDFFGLVGPNASGKSTLLKSMLGLVKVRSIMEMIEIMHLADQTLDTLSGGEMQRVLLARALIVEPEVLLLDEPTAAMDLVASQKFMSLITRLHHQRNVTVIIVTHDLSSLIGRAHRLGIIQHGMVHSGPADELLTSENLTNIYREPMVVKRVDGHTLIMSQTEMAERN